MSWLAFLGAALLLGLLLVCPLAILQSTSKVQSRCFGVECAASERAANPFSIAVLPSLPT